MLTLGHTITAALVVAALSPASTALAEVDVSSAVRDLAEEAIGLVGDERDALATLDRGEVVVDREAVVAELAEIDAAGAELLGRFDQLDVELSHAARAALEPLATAADGTADGPIGPPAVVYDTAAVDLMRISATPDAVVPGGGRSASPAWGLLVVAAISLVVLGGAALANTLRRRPETEELVAMAWSDNLTGLANRRRLHHDLEFGDRADETAAIMVDIDDFRSVILTYGHHEGDEVVRAVGAVIARHVRSGDVVYRYGGEEFCILLPNATAHDARRVADRIVEAARDIELPDGTHITVSAGVAGTAGAQPDTAIESADRALNLAKEQGRDRVVTAVRAVGER